MKRRPKSSFFASPKLWRRWLAANHARVDELWVGFYKRGSGKPSITWPRAQPAAWRFFKAQAPWYQRTAMWWVISAKREETRQKRLATLIDDSAHGHRIGPLRERSKS